MPIIDPLESSGIVDPFETGKIKPRKKATMQSELQPEVDKMTGTQKFVTGIGGGLMNVYHGLKQLGAEAGNKVGLVSPETVKRVTQEGEFDRNLTAQLKGDAPWYKNPATIGETVGKIAPAMAIPGGTGVNLLRRAATGAMAGAALGASEFVPEGGSRTQNALLGGATGGMIPVAVPLAGKAASYLVKPALGKLTGAGSGSVEEAFKSGYRTVNPFKSETPFSKAMRGKTSGDDVVNMAQEALQTIKDKRAAAYQEKLKGIIEKSKDPVPNAGGNQIRPYPASNIDVSPIINKATELAGRYGIRVTDEGGLDFSRIAMDRRGRRDIANVVKLLSSWGSKEGDKTAIGLDTLKRQLDDFYSESSAARQFVASLRKTVHDTISKHVPEYAEMTKKYAEDTKLIKDIESGLMMRPTDISGRITHDQTLRRLTSAMRDNFELRRDLVDALGAHGAKDIGGNIAGYTMSTALPRQLGTTGALVISEIALAKLINPKFWPVIAMSSPRVAGEFIHGLGYGKKVADQIANAIPEKVKELGTRGVQRLAVESIVESGQPSPKWQEIGEEEEK